jgi:hypothetical protein
MARDSEHIRTEWLVLHAQSGNIEALEQLLKLWYPKLAGVVVYCALVFYGTDDPAAKLDWMAVGLAAFFALGLLRLWFLMELNRLSLAREIKRLELQVAAVASALRPPASAATGHTLRTGCAS